MYIHLNYATSHELSSAAAEVSWKRRNVDIPRAVQADHKPALDLNTIVPRTLYISKLLAH